MQELVAYEEDWWQIGSHGGGLWLDKNGNLTSNEMRAERHGSQSDAEASWREIWGEAYPYMLRHVTIEDRIYK